MADEVPTFGIYVQGGESVITKGSDGMFVITIQDLVPFFHAPDRERSSLVPVELLTNLTGPLNGALVFSENESESVPLVEISDLSWSDDNTVLTLVVAPKEFYEGEVLASFNRENARIDVLETPGSLITGIYIELEKKPDVNDYDPCAESLNKCLYCCNYGMINPHPMTCDDYCKNKHSWCYQQGLC
ncbi:MAG: hypothetical protein JXA44_07210 [Methanospirillaceae archaeon]|nr:hypothetical protein [Methanospirillaceae archaeon]